MAHWTSLAVKKYNLFAFETLTRSTNKRLGSPFGCLSDLSGLGSPGAFLFSGGIDLALEADPPGGAMKMPTTGSSANHCINRLTPTSVVKSAITTCAAACLFRMWSVPNALIMPILRSSAVTLAAPAKISITMQSEMSAPSTGQCTDAALASLLFVVVFLSMGGKAALTATKMPSLWTLCSICRLWTLVDLIVEAQPTSMHAHVCIVPSKGRTPFPPLFFPLPPPWCPFPF